jgi:hypothetical protein
MNADELLRHTFPWEIAPGVPASDESPDDPKAPQPA